MKVKRASVPLIAAFVAIFIFAAPGPSFSSEGTCSSGSCRSGDTVSCEAPGVSSEVADSLIDSFRESLEAASRFLETQLHDRVVEFLKSEYIQAEWIEYQMIDWWRTMWSYNLFPGLQSMTRLFNTNLMFQQENLQIQADASNALDLNLALQRHEIENQQARPGEQICVAGTVAGGFTRANGFSRAMRRAWEKESLDVGLNTEVEDGRTPSGVASQSARYRTYIRNFCDPQSNGGRNHENCGSESSEDLWNADVQAVRHLYNALTIPVDEDARQADMVQSLFANLVGTPETSPLARGALNSPKGRWAFMTRRSYLARHAALSSVPYLMAGWRMPGSQVEWARGLRLEAGVPEQEASQNPSYKEIMHAVSVDRFNTGVYASNMMTDPSKVEMERLSLSVFHLMQLRDYYELLERTALTLAVQVSLLAEKKALSEGISSVAPLRRSAP